MNTTTDNAQGLPDWRELARRLYVELHYCDQQMTAGPRSKFTQGATVRNVLADAKEALATHPPQQERANTDRADALMDSAYLAGAKAGWNLGVVEDNEGFARLQASRAGYLSVLKSAPAAPATPDPAARKGWPFVESPGAFAARLEVAIRHFGGVLPAIRNVLIEEPPQFVATPESAEPVALPMDTAPRDGTLVRLLVEFEDHDVEDGEGPHWTIGAVTCVGDDDAEFQFVGWNWCQDHWLDGIGKPIGWLPFHAGTHPTPAASDVNEWREAVLDELAITHVHPASDTPRDILKAIIAWHVQCARDPQVSASDGGLREALRRIAEGNLGGGPGQADYARIRAVAKEALDRFATPPTEHEPSPAEPITRGTIKFGADGIAIEPSAPNATAEACLQVIREVVSDIRHSGYVDGYTVQQARFLASIADRIEQAALIGGALRTVEPVAAPAQVTDAELSAMLCAFVANTAKRGDDMRAAGNALLALRSQTGGASSALRAAQPGAGGVVVPRAMLEQVYGMTREGCDAPNVAYRWCERIDELFHMGGASDEYVEFAQALPDAIAGQQKGVQS